MQINKQAQTANLAMLQYVAEKLTNLCDEVVFLGGCTTALFITEPAAPDARRTLDVDCIVDVISLSQYHKFSEKLQGKGFKQVMEDDVICRWRIDNVILDVMPINEEILGFGNCWYPDAIKHAVLIKLNNKAEIKILTAPYFLATKLEAFKTRGNMDYFASHDFEDIISVIDGRAEIKEEVLSSPDNLKLYLSDKFSEILSKQQFHDALPGHLNYGAVIDSRIELVKDRITQIANAFPC